MAVARYEIRVKGRMSGSLQSAFPDLTTQIEPVETVLTGDFDDQSALYGVLLQIEGLGLELVEVRHVARGRGRRDRPPGYDGRQLHSGQPLFGQLRAGQLFRGVSAPGPPPPRRGAG